MLIYIFLLLTITITFYVLFGNTPYQWKVLPLSLAVVPRVFTLLTKPILFLFHFKGFHVVIYLDDILNPIHSKHTARRAQTLSVVCIGLSWFTS